GIGAVRPLLRARPFLLHRFPKCQRSSRERPYVGWMHVLPYVLFHACHQCILKYLASRHPIDGHFLHRCRALRSANFAPCSGDISEPSSRVCVVRKVRQPPSHGFRGQARIRFAPAVDQSVAGIVLRQAQAFLMKVHKQSLRPIARYRIAMITTDRKTIRVAFQGEPGAFSEAAVIQLLGESITTVPRATFEAIFRSIAEGAADAILAPVENSLAGSVVRVFDLLLESQLAIVAETILPIEMQLI